MALKTSQSINGFIASDPRLTFNDDGQARFYARIGINHYRCEKDGSFTELEPSFHDLIQFGKGAELSGRRFRKGDSFLAQGHVRDHAHTVDGQQRTDEQFVAKRVAHDPNTTTYHVERHARSSERETLSAGRKAASRNGTRELANQAVVAAASDVAGF